MTSPNLDEVTSPATVLQEMELGELKKIGSLSASTVGRWLHILSPINGGDN